MAKNPPGAHHRTPEQLDALATTLFNENPECDVLCSEIEDAENELDELMQSTEATNLEKAAVVARIRALTRHRQSLHCARPCFFT